VVQERVVEPVGSENRLEIDVRLIAAANIDLKDAVSQGKFREDLYYRLNVIPIHVPSLKERPEDIPVPSLKERPEDIPVLAGEFLRRFVPGALSDYNWPGNIRELENLMERMAILRKSDILAVNDLPADFNSAISRENKNSVFSGKDLTYHEAEKKLIIDALDKCAWNKSKAAKQLNIARHVLIYRMKKYDLF